MSNFALRISDFLSIHIWVPSIGITVLLLSAQPALSHEAWLLEPKTMLELFDAPLSGVWQSVSVVSVSIAAALFLAMVLAEYLDRRFQPLEQRLDRKYRDRMRHIALLILRVTLGSMMIAAAIGFNPRYGTEIFAEPTLFVPDLELTGATTAASIVAGIQLLAGAALVLGLYVNLASVVTIILVAVGFILFGPQIMLSYAGHLLAPAIILIAEDPDRFEHNNPRDAHVEKLVQRAFPFLTLERSLVMMRVMTGLTFMYLAVMDKFLHSPQLEAIIESHFMPTFGIPPEALVFVMAAVELAGGFALVVGIAERLVAGFLIGAMLFFALVLGESPLLHANIIGILIAIILLGPGYIDTKQSLRPGRERITFATVRIVAVAVVATSVALSSLWVSDLRARVPAADARLVHYTGSEATQPRLDGVKITQLDDQFFRVDIATRGFLFTANQLRADDLPFQGHAHVYAGSTKIATLYGREGIVGPVPDDVTILTITLMNTLHCYVSTNNGVLIIEALVHRSTEHNYFN